MNNNHTETKEEISVQLICRLCLTERENYQPIFDDEDSSIADWIHDLTSLEIVKIPDKRALLCSECKIALKAFESFRNACFANDKLYKELCMRTNQRKEPLVELEALVDPVIHESIEEDVLNIQDCKSDEECIVILEEQIDTDVVQDEQSVPEEDYVVYYLDACTESVDENDKDGQKMQTSARPRKSKFGKIGEATAPDVSNKKLCKICNKFVNRLSQHQLTHRAVRLFQCEFCSKGFNQMSNLKKHVRTHTKEKPYLCSWCEKKFTSSTELKVHTRSHTLEKPFNCKDCGKSFITSGHLVRHARSHSGAKPYSCEVCLTKFSTSSHLVRHKRLHSLEYPYSCPVCDGRFMRTEYLKAHKCKL